MGRLREWMEAAGMETRSDALGNLAGRRGGGPALMIGSHLDSVADAGRYDGILGVLVGLAVVEALDEDVPVELVAFADEEGLRFQSTFLGSRAFVGKLEPASWSSVIRTASRSARPSKARSASRCSTAPARISRSTSSRVRCSRRPDCRSGW